ncbi:hypothetical protein KI659_17740 [Litoribacter alkaliphilus]|uniref:Uncharacterized protein n=1 Tax=Litoribacter ruber TaxID=702568 RepID=A0AAP2CJF2_9BACT|nr:hypothetical protein [Litoribacter alkaliphilus]MBS9525868.1 hypothetical protein [Litoribacter alkaliphilus]
MFKLFSAFIGKESAKMEKASYLLKNVGYVFLIIMAICLFNIFQGAGFLAYVTLFIFTLFFWQLSIFRKKLNFAISIGRKAAMFADTADQVKNAGREVYNDLRNGEFDPEKIDKIAVTSEGLLNDIKQTCRDLDNSNIKL